MHNSMAVFTFFAFDWKYLFLGKFGPRNQNYNLKIITYKLKFVDKPNSTMQNSMMQLTVFVFHWECPFWADFVQNVKIVSLRRTLIRRVIDMQNSMMLLTVFVFDRKCPFWVNLVQIVNVQIVSLRWNLIPIIIWICRTQWRCSLFSFYRKRPFWANLVENVKVVSSRLNLVASIQLHWHLDTTNSRF